MSRDGSGSLNQSRAHRDREKRAKTNQHIYRSSNSSSREYLSLSLLRVDSKDELESQEAHLSGASIAPLHIRGGLRDYILARGYALLGLLLLLCWAPIYALLFRFCADSSFFCTSELYGSLRGSPEVWREVERWNYYGCALMLGCVWRWRVFNLK